MSSFSITIIPVILRGVRRTHHGTECQVFITIIGSSLRALSQSCGSRVKVKRRSRDSELGKNFPSASMKVYANGISSTRTHRHAHTSTRTRARLVSRSSVFLSVSDLFTRRSAETSCRKVIKKLDSHRSLWAS